ncbi:MAG: hypothetical protein J6Y62_00870 [Clostridia bacterium]|nr:hypothetical protein [Clostridia bacterium]
MPTIKVKRWTLHPSIEIVKGVPKLTVFENFVADPSLKKESDDKNKKTSYTTPSFYRQTRITVSWLEWIKRKWASWRNPEKEDRPGDTLDKAKAAAKPFPDNEELSKIALKVQGLEKKLRDNGQTALADKFHDQAEAVSKEILLAKKGFNKYIEEADMVELFKLAEYGLRLDWWCDYKELAPDAALNKRELARGIGVLDNFCVLHYDPQGKRLREEEIEEMKRDPILFGVMRCSRRLYFIADWTTDKDDVTVKKICATLGRKGLDDIKKSREYSDVKMATNSDELFDEMVFPDDSEEGSEPV